MCRHASKIIYLAIKNQNGTSRRWDWLIFKVIFTLFFRLFRASWISNQRNPQKCAISIPPTLDFPTIPPPPPFPHLSPSVHPYPTVRFLRIGRLACPVPLGLGHCSAVVAFRRRIILGFPRRGGTMSVAENQKSHKVGPLKVKPRVKILLDHRFPPNFGHSKFRLKFRASNVPTCPKGLALPVLSAIRVHPFPLFS